MQTTGMIMVAIKRCSLVGMSMPGQGDVSAHRLLYLAAVRRHQARAGASLAAPASYLMLRWRVQAKLPSSGPLRLTDEGPPTPSLVGAQGRL
jgi:hypothetical protein